MKLFDFFRKKANKTAQDGQSESNASFEARKAKYQLKKAYLDKTYEEITDKMFEEEQKIVDRLNEESDKRNSTCPHCGGHNIIQVFRRPKGEIHGSGSYSGSLFGGYGGGSINGSLDGLKVNKCKDCEQEWEYEEKAYSAYSNTENAFRSLFYHVERITEVSFNPKDVTEEFNSLEEKRQHEIDEASNTVAVVLDTGVTIETLAYYFCKRNYNLWESKSDFGKEVDNDYLYEFNKDVTRALEDLGFKHAEI